jgi:hypothetical protein
MGDPQDRPPVTSDLLYPIRKKGGCLRAAIFAGQNSFKMVFLRKYGKIQRIFPAVDARIPESDPAFVLLANGARNGLILDHLFYQAPPPMERLASTA